MFLGVQSLHLLLFREIAADAHVLALTEGLAAYVVILLQSLPFLQPLHARLSQLELLNLATRSFRIVLNKEDIFRH